MILLYSILFVFAIIGIDLAIVLTWVNKRTKCEDWCLEFWRQSRNDPNTQRLMREIQEDVERLLDSEYIYDEPGRSGEDVQGSTRELSFTPYPEPGCTPFVD